MRSSLKIKTSGLLFSILGTRTTHTPQSLHAATLGTADPDLDPGDSLTHGLVLVPGHATGTIPAPAHDTATADTRFPTPAHAHAVATEMTLVLATGTRVLDHDAVREMNHVLDRGTDRGTRGLDRGAETETTPALTHVDAVEIHAHAHAHDSHAVSEKGNKSNSNFPSK